MKKVALILMVLTILSKVFGFLREITLAYIYGTSNISDAYLISTTIPRVIFGFVTVGIISAFIPMYSKIFEKNGEDEARNFTNNLINTLLIVVTIIVSISLLFTEAIVSVFASGFDIETFDMTVKFTRICLFALYFLVVISVFTGYLQSKNKFVIPALIGLPFNIVIIISLFISVKLNVLIALPIGFVIAISTQFLFMVYTIRKVGFKYKRTINFKDQHLKKMFFIALPVILGISVNQINVLIDRTLASQIAIGGISALNYASTLNEFVQGIFVLSIATVLYPLISAMAVKNDMIGLKNSLSGAMTGIFITVLPITFITMTFAVEVVTLLFGRGAFDINAISMTSYALFFYSIGMIGFGLREVLSRVFYSMQDTRTPMINASIGMALNIILNIFLSRYLGIGGLALATSIAAIFTSLLMLVSLRRKIGPFGIKRMTNSFIKILIASLIMSFVANKTFNFANDILSQSFSLLLAVVASVISYCVIIYFMKVDDVEIIVNALKKKITKVRGSI
ncbi:murein biosynthesis integral membrane protein MurJ [Bacillus sp. FJAT-45350]|uniref:murein biosynthesis integral membrane protein MurJ n=1 Tax=Bacillus sp. FJAT-45350 TaxID=2011014 RepID=UPI0015CD1D1B|nr:murein biosynthesis integral membrane protein MurJ [Bacillus sp. FJAT-45350]